jgi:carboxyl-terminal processing protease
LAAKRKVDESITAEYQRLLTALNETMHDKTSKEIKIIVDAIDKRFNYEEGFYQYSLKTNSEIKKAVSGI